jgi:hypothetical protein
MANEDQARAYQEACAMLRHYSNASLTVRLASVVQGIAILGAWAVALTQKISQLMIILPIVGLLFTALLYRFNRGYFRATQFFYGISAQMEERLFDVGFRPATAYVRRHEKIYRSSWAKVFTLQAPFTLIAILFLVALATSSWMLFRK